MALCLTNKLIHNFVKYIPNSVHTICEQANFPSENSKIWFEVAVPKKQKNPLSDFRKFLDQAQQTSPLKRNVTIEEVGNAAAFLCSDLASGITGEIVYVDAGYNMMGMA